MYCLLPLHEVLFDLECSDSCNNDSKVIGKKKEKEEIKTNRKKGNIITSRVERGVA